MATLVKAVDQALGYTAPHLSSSEAHEHEVDASQFFRTLDGYSLSKNSDVQERWLDHKDVYDEFEREVWAQEGKQVQEASRSTEKEKKAKPKGPPSSG